MYEISVREHFDAAHYIKNYKGKCSREHGHTWEVEVLLLGNTLDECNMLVDFTELKAKLKGLIDTYLDHTQLNESLNEPNLTAEFLAEWIYKKFESLSKDGIELVEVTVFESPLSHCGVTYYPDEDASIQ